MKKNLLSLLLLSFFALSSAFAQSRKITGSVTGSDDGKPIAGVTVKVTGTSVGTQTGVQGDFSLTVPAGAGSLTFTYLGYEPKTVKISATTTKLTVDLTQDSKSLNEVVVTGYGVQNKKEITGSVSSIKGSDFADQPVQTFDRAIQGRAAGVQVTSGGGQPGSSMSVIIRGVATINGTTQPLYIVDGVQIQTTTTLGGSVSGVATLDALSSINPDDIESIEILKDAASAAIYGSLAANGVVIVNTKRGKAGKTQINASVQYGRSQPLNPYKVLGATDWFALRKEAFENVATRTGNSVTAADAAANASISSLYPGGVIPNPLPSYDWIKAINQTGQVGQYDLSLSGGDAKTTFFISGSYNSTDGTILNSKFSRGTLRGNITNQVSDKFSVTASFGLTGTGTSGPSSSAGFFTNGAFTGTLFTPPVNPIYNADGTYNTALVGVNSLNEIQNNAFELISSGAFQTVDNLSMTYKILPELSFKAFGGLDFSDVRDFDYRPSNTVVGASSNGQSTETYRRNINYNTSGTFNFAKKIGDNSISAIAGFEYRSVTNRVETGASTGFPSPLFILLSNGSTPITTISTFTGYRVAGYLANISYKYKDKYYLTLNGRDDGSSRFGANHKFGLFYGASAGWDMTKEDFMKDVTFISQLKPRVSYGVVGELPSNNFGSIAQYGASGQYAFGTGTALAPSGVTGGIAPSQLAVPDLSWERSAQIDVGLDFGFFNNRINGSLDFYRKTNTQLILNEQLPGDTGFTSIAENAGSAKSEGYDFQLNTVNVDAGGFRWNTTFNLGYNRTLLLSLYNGVQQISSFQYTVGQPLNLIYTQKWAGVNPADGRGMYYGADGNLTYNPKTTDQGIVAHQYPSFTGGFSNNFSYKGLMLDALFQYQYGNSSYLQAQQYIETSGDVAANQTVNQLMRWTTPGQITAVPRAYNGGTEPGAANVQTLSTRYVSNGSYIRLKEIGLTYTIPKSWSQTIGVPSLSVFAQGLNLVTITNYRGDDPENTGNNLNFYPNPKTFTAGIKAKF